MRYNSLDINDFYRSTNSKTWQQKLDNLEKRLGKINTDSNPTTKQKVIMLEQELLKLELTRK